LKTWLVTLLLVPLAGCHRVDAPASGIRTGDPAAAAQLVSGFYGIEGHGANAWRWTKPDFSLALAPPPGSERGARLRVRLYFPETQIRKLGPITLTAFVDEQPLKPETFSAGGSQDFVRDIPACFLNTSVLPVRFSFDPYVPKSGTDGRDLGAVVTEAELVAPR
jgi:hypothetical protein